MPLHKRGKRDSFSIFLQSVAALAEYADATNMAIVLQYVHQSLFWPDARVQLCLTKN